MRVKHGKATSVSISLTQAKDRLILAVEDNGTGFQPPAVGSTGMGIRIMRYRARMIGGRPGTEKPVRHGHPNHLRALHGRLKSARCCPMSDVASHSPRLPETGTSPASDKSRIFLVDDHACFARA